MAVKIRLQRHGKKGKPFYHIVAADARAKRDGRYIEKIGTYNPTTNPASIDLQIDRAVNWLQNGAVPTDTARAILSYKGAMYKNHLVNGVRKGAFDDAEAEKRFETWVTEKSAKIASQAENIAKGIQDKHDAIFTAEKAQNEARIKDIAAKTSALAEEVAAAEVAAEEPAAEEVVAEETATEEVVAEEPAVEEAVAEDPAVEEVVAEDSATEEVVAEEPAAEEVVAEEPATEEVVAEEPAAEEVVAEEPAAEEVVAEEPAAEEVVAEEPASKDDSKSEE